MAVGKISTDTFQDTKSPSDLSLRSCGSSLYFTDGDVTLLHVYQ